MKHLRILLLLVSQGKTRRQMMQSSSLSRRTIDNYIARFQATGMSYEALSILNDEDLKTAVHPVIPNGMTQKKDQRHGFLEENINRYFLELQKKHVTRQLLWEEYRVEVPDGYSYTQFCERLKDHSRMKQASMTMTHHPGQVMQFDFAGDMLSYVDKFSGEIHRCPVLIGVLPFSGLLFVVALENARQPQLVVGLNATVAYFGGVTESVLSDNLSQSVTAPSRYEPLFTDVISGWGLHNRTVITATRVAKPKDKPSVEGGVRAAYYRVYAPLRNQTYHSLRELNQAIVVKVDAYNNTRFQNKQYSRRSLFEESERSYLVALPNQAFMMYWVTRSKVGKNYCVIVGEDMHYYSVPYTYIGKRVNIVYTPDSVEIYHGQERIAFHERATSRYGVSILPIHMPEKHRAYKNSQELDEQHFLDKASLIGPKTLAVVKRVFGSKTYAPQAFNICFGILKLEAKYGTSRLEAASLRAEMSPSVGYQILKNILEKGLDREVIPEVPFTNKIITNSNVRGPEEFQ